MGIKVNQFDNTGKLIASYNSYSEAADNLGCDESTIRKAAKYNKLVYGKFYFEDSELRNPEIQIDSIYEIGKSSKLNEQPEVIELVRKSPKILLIDIETAPLRAYTFAVWKQNITHIISQWFIICWSAKWLGEEEVFGDCLTSEEAIKQDDKRIMATLWGSLDNADIIVAHNGNKFDIPKINTRFLINGFMPPSPYKQIDTYIIANQNFGFTFNSLNELAKALNVGEKAPTTHKLWEDCMIGDSDALEYMSLYCDQDIIVLEGVFLKLRPYAKGLPNLDLYQDSITMVCPVCGKPHLKEVPDKYFYTQAVKYQLYRCKNCGGLARAKKGIKFENTKQISAIPR